MGSSPAVERPELNPVEVMGQERQIGGPHLVVLALVVPVSMVEIHVSGPVTSHARPPTRPVEDGGR